MKAECTCCKQHYDETSWMQFVTYLSPARREEYFAQQMCPECYRTQFSTGTKSLIPELTKILEINP